MTRLLLILFPLAVCVALDQRFLLLYELTGKNYAFAANSFFGSTNIWIKALNIGSIVVPFLAVGLYVVILFLIVKNRNFTKVNWFIIGLIFFSAVYIFLLRNLDYTDFYRFFPMLYQEIPSRELFRENSSRGINCIKWEKVINEKFTGNYLINYSWINPRDTSSTAIVSKDCLVEAGAKNPETENQYLLVKLNVEPCRVADFTIWENKITKKLTFQQKNHSGRVCTLMLRDYDTQRALIEYSRQMPGELH